jgi:hypothetical protein
MLRSFEEAKYDKQRFLVRHECLVVVVQRAFMT